MAEHQKHLYMIVFPINALVASQLNPADFGAHYTTGSAKHYHGKVIFAEIDINFRNSFFDIDHYLALTVPHSDASPKKTKFVSSYTVLEHTDLKAFRNLYLVTTNGKVLEIAAQQYAEGSEQGKVRIYQEITPLSNLVASRFDPRTFGKYITSETKSKGAPKICFTQYEVKVDEFLEKNKEHDMVYSPIPETHPTLLFDYLTELKTHPDKKTKTLSLNNTLFETSYAMLRHGFWFAAGDELFYYLMSSKQQLENEYYGWWKFVQ